MDAVNGDAEILMYLAEKDFPAERVAHAKPVSVLAGQPVLVTEYVPGSNRRYDESAETIECLSSMLGRLHSLPDGPAACRRPAGGWHHLSVNGGGRRSDADILLKLLKDAAKRMPDDERARLPELLHELEELDDLDDLPKALIHPDPCGANLVAPASGEGVLVDWTGAGMGPRVLAFATLIGSVKARALVDAAVAGYRRHATLEPDELERLEAALVGFPFVLDCWTVLFRGAGVSEALHQLTTHRQRAKAIARRARSAFGERVEPARPTSEDKQATLF
jgi:Ser/Thr protein kinase RdoA (MazF antagonist)